MKKEKVDKREDPKENPEIGIRPYRVCQLCAGASSKCRSMNAIHREGAGGGSFQREEDLKGKSQERRIECNGVEEMQSGEEQKGPVDGKGFDLPLQRQNMWQLEYYHSADAEDTDE